MQKCNLQFIAYKHDPLAWLLKHTWKWSNRRFGITFTAFYLVLMIAGIVAYFVRDGTPNLLLLGGYESQFTVFIGLMVAAMGAATFYAHVSDASGKLYLQLTEAEVLATSDNQTPPGLVDTIKSLKALHDRRIWTIVSILFPVTILAAILVYGGMPLSEQAISESARVDKQMVTQYRALFTIVTSPAWALGLYMVAMLVIRSSITIWGLKKVFLPGSAKFTLCIQTVVGGWPRCVATPLP